MNTTVYIHKRGDTNQTFYVGIGRSSRPYDVRNRNKHWKHIADKHGYHVEILYENVSWETACDIERQLIKEYGRIDIGTGILVNMTDGGDGTRGAKLSKETRKRMSENAKVRKWSGTTKRKMSKSAMGNKNSAGVKRDSQYKLRLSTIHINLNKSAEYRKRKSESLKGRLFSEEHKRNISLSKIGKPQPESFIKKRGTSVLQYDLDGNISKIIWNFKIFSVYLQSLYIKK